MSWRRQNRWQWSSVSTGGKLDENSNIEGGARVVIAHQNDTLLDIARRFDLGYDEVVAANPQVNP
jgi:L,D-transpeptidase ErfK/SrfK